MVRSATEVTVHGTEFTVWICEAGHKHWSPDMALQCPIANEVIRDAQAKENESRQESS